jgi:hypothetical protein
MTAGSQPSLCPGCSEISDECVCWEADHDAWDPRLLAAFNRHEPCLDLSALCTRTELGETGCLVEVIDERGWISLRVYFDDEEGDVYLVPQHVEYAEEMAELVRAAEPELILWPDRPAGSGPEPRGPDWRGR